MYNWASTNYDEVFSEVTKAVNQTGNYNSVNAHQNSLAHLSTSPLLAALMPLWYGEVNKSLERAPNAADVFYKVMQNTSLALETVKALLSWRSQPYEIVIHPVVITRNITFNLEVLDGIDCPGTRLKTLELGLTIERYDKVRVFLKDRNLVIVSNKPLDELRMRRLFAALPTVFPQLITERTPLEIYKTLLEETPDNFIAMATVSLKLIIGDIKFKQIKNTLVKVQQRRCDKVKNNFENLTKTLSDYDNERVKTIRSLQQVEAELFWLNENVTSSTSALAEEAKMLNECPYIVSVEESSNSSASKICLNVSIRTPLRTYNMNEAQKCFIKNLSNEWKPVFQNILVDQTHDLWVGTFSEISTDRCTRISNSSVPDSMPNPHHYLANCYGNYSGLIRAHMSKNNIVLAIMQLITCVGSMNFLDGVITHSWLRSFNEPHTCTNNAAYMREVPCVEVDNKFMTLVEYKAYLEAQAKAKAEAEEAILNTVSKPIPVAPPKPKRTKAPAPAPRPNTATIEEAPLF